MALVSGAAAADRLDAASSYAELRDALEQLTRAAYGRTDTGSATLDSALDDAMDIADRAASRLQREKMWIRTAVQRLIARCRRREPQAWTR